MTTENWILIVSAALVAIGWVATWWLGQRSEIAKERRSYRLDMLHSFYPLLFFLQKKMNGETFSKQETEEFNNLLSGPRSKFLLYGEKDEIDAYENLVAECLGENNQAKIDRLNKLAEIVRTKIRAELRLPRHILPVR